jgi:hypothetical protein
MVSFIANVVAVPLVGVILGLGFAVSAAGMIFFPLGEALGTLGIVLIRFLLKYIEIISSLPYAYIYVVSPGIIFFAAYYAFVLLMPYAGGNKKAKAAIILIPVVYVLLNLPVYTRACPDLKITFLDFKGSAACVRLPGSPGSPGNKTVLLMGETAGKSTWAVKNLISSYLFKQGVSRVEALFVVNAEPSKGGSSAEADILKERFGKIEIYGCDNPRESFSRVGGNLNINFLENPGKPSKKGVPLLLEYGKFRMLFTGEAALNTAAIAEGVSVVQLSGKNVTPRSMGFIRKLSPKYAIITNSKKSPWAYGELPGVEVAATQDGAVTITAAADGSVKREKFIPGDP